MMILMGAVAVLLLISCLQMYSINQILRSLKWKMADLLEEMEK